MILFPAIDLKDGACVRLKEGRMESATVFHKDPVQQAARLEEQGFSCLHIVDLNKATGEGKSNRAVVARIVAETSLPVQLGGGIRERADIEGWLEMGVQRVVLGTALFEAAEMARQATKDYAGRVVFALDSREGRVLTHGWKGARAESLLEAARHFADWKPAAFLYTETGRDGLKTGLDLETTERLASATPIPVIASGGLSGLEDLERLSQSAAVREGRIEGVIAGRALYDGLLPPKEALRLAPRLFGEAAPC